LAGADAILPGDSFTIMTYESFTGTPTVVNQTGYAGLLLNLQMLDTSVVLSASALGGDANLDGTVDTIDFNILASNFSNTGANWLVGDFNADTSVDTLDFN